MQRILTYLLPVGLAITPGLRGAPPSAQVAKQILAAQTPAELLASRFVAVTETPEAWQLRYGDETVTWDKATLQLQLTGPNGDWELQTPKNAIVRQDGKDYTIALDSAARRSFQPEEFGGTAGVKVRLDGFQADGVALDIRMVLFVGLEWETGDILVELRPDEGAGAWREVHWPGPIRADNADAAILPFMQGVMIPRHWPERFEAPYNDGPGYGLTYGRNLYMPWWGFTRGGDALMMILENPEDAGIGIRHTPEQGTTLEPWQLHSLGKLGYTRKMRLRPLTGNHVQMAQSFRDYLKERGKFVSLAEKIARTPKVERLIGSPIIHTQAEYTDMRRPEHPEGVSWHTTYAEHIANMARLKAQGFDDIYWHIDGIGYRGYDNLEPDQLPVGKNAGGVEGLRAMLKAAQDTGYQVVYHQQFRDFYLDAASFDENLAKRNEDGSMPIDDYWAGGKNAILCPLRSADYTRRNNTVLELLDAPVDGCYLDVFAVVPGDECYHPEHRISRTQCYDLRRECFQYIKNKWGITSSEEPVGWAVPYLDLVHHAPWPVTPEKKSFGIQLPLHTLVYHDSIVIPWDSDGRRGKGYYYPSADIPYLHNLLNAGMPYLNETASDDDVKRVQFAAGLHRRLGKQPMVNHELLNDSGRRQRATYADGTRITTDQDAGSVEIVYPEGGKNQLQLNPETGAIQIQTTP